MCVFHQIRKVRHNGYKNETGISKGSCHKLYYHHSCRHRPEILYANSMCF